MTAAAKRNEILTAVVSTFRQRLDVMYLFRFHQQPLLIAQLTERMLLHILVTDALPGTTVPTLSLRVPVVLLVALILQPFMLRAEAAIRQVGTSGKGTGTLWFVWHSVLLLRTYD